MKNFEAIEVSFVSP